MNLLIFVKVTFFFFWLGMFLLVLALESRLWEMGVYFFLCFWQASLCASGIDYIGVFIGLCMLVDDKRKIRVVI